MPSFMIVRLETSEFKREQKKSGRTRLRCNAVENQNSTLPMQLQVIYRSYLISFMIVRLETSEIKREQKKSGRARLWRNAVKNQNSTLPMQLKSFRGPTWQVS